MSVLSSIMMERNNFKSSIKSTKETSIRINLESKPGNSKDSIPPILPKDSPLFSIKSNLHLTILFRIDFNGSKFGENATNNM
jgi:hypothetical protein